MKGNKYDFQKQNELKNKMRRNNSILVSIYNQKVVGVFF